MGDRYFLTVKCDRCGNVDKNVYYAPTCDFTKHNCSACRKLIDLRDYSGISYEDATNIDNIKNLIRQTVEERNG